jgi:hypothetical protein
MGYGKRFRRKWAIWRIGKPSCSQVLFKRAFTFNNLWFGPYCPNSLLPIAQPDQKESAFYCRAVRDFIVPVEGAN